MLEQTWQVEATIDLTCLSSQHSLWHRLLLLNERIHLQIVPRMAYYKGYLRGRKSNHYIHYQDRRLTSLQTLRTLFVRNAG
jgi:hypothetical protein